MMISPISSATLPQQVAQPTKTDAKAPLPSASSGDAVTLSKTAQALAAALQEARETPAQTTREAGNGDLQARRLLATEAAAKPAK